MTPKQRKKAIKRFLNQGYRHSYHYNSGIGDLDTSLIFKMVATNAETARELAEKTLGGVDISIYDLNKELEKL